MKKKLFAGLLWCMATLVSCGKQEEPTSSHPDDCRVEVSLTVGQNTVSRLFSPQTSGQEPALRDVNLYAFHTLTGNSRHIYLTGSTSHSFSLPAGEWDFYVLANTGQDMGAFERERMKTLVLDVPDERIWTSPDGIPMSAHKRVEITGNTSVTLELKRLAARLRVNVGIAPAMSGRITVNNVQLISVPATVGWFGQQPPQCYIDYPAEEVSSMNLPRTYYVAENLAGTVPEITRPQERSAHAAPDNATCIRITGVCDGRTAHYYVFPGENTTSDFNVQRNRDYMLNITLYGANPEDARVATYEMTFTPDCGEAYAGGTFSTVLNFIGTGNGNNTFDIAWRLISGEAELSVWGGIPSPPGTFYYGLEGNEINESFDIGITSQQEGTVEIEVYVTDRYGQTLTRRVTVTFLPSEKISIEMFYDYGVLKTRLSNYEYDLRAVVTLRLWASAPLPAPLKITFDYYWTSIYTDNPYNPTRHEETYTLELEAGKAMAYEYLFDVDIPMLRHPIYHIDGYYTRDGFMIVEEGGISITSVSDPPSNFVYHLAPVRVTYRGPQP